VDINLEIRASANHFADYRKLVDSDWNGKTFVAALQLLWEVVTLPADRKSQAAEWIVSLKSNPSTTPVAMPDELNQALTVLTRFFRDPQIPRKWKEHPTKKSRLTQQAEATITSLLLQFLFTLNGETGFFRDLQSLLYLNAIHYI
jgi:hypothetical protein